MTTGKIKNNKVVYYTKRYNFISPRGPATSGGDAISLEIDNFADFDLEEGDRVKFEITENKTAIIDKITEKKELNVSMGQIMETIQEESSDYSFIDLNLYNVHTDETGDYVFRYKIVFTPIDNEYHKYIIELDTEFLIETNKKSWIYWFNLYKDDSRLYKALRASIKRTERYDGPSKNIGISGWN